MCAVRRLPVVVLGVPATGPESRFSLLSRILSLGSRGLVWRWWPARIVKHILDQSNANRP